LLLQVVGISLPVPRSNALKTLEMLKLPLTVLPK
jgi:hypothetical protein